MCKAATAAVTVSRLKPIANNLLRLYFVKDCECLTLKSCSQHSSTDLRSHRGRMWSIFSFFLPVFINFQDLKCVNQRYFILRWFCYSQEIREEQMHPRKLCGLPALHWCSGHP